AWHWPSSAEPDPVTALQPPARLASKPKPLPTRALPADSTLVTGRANPLTHRPNTPRACSTRRLPAKFPPSPQSESLRMPSLSQALRAALERRQPLLEQLHPQGTDCYRLFHGSQEGAPGLTADRYGPQLLVQ